MGLAYENRREEFEKIKRKYNDYLKLYKAVNNGSLQGACNFGEFYWRFTFHSKYVEGAQKDHRGY